MRGAVVLIMLLAGCASAPPEPALEGVTALPPEQVVLEGATMWNEAGADPYAMATQPIAHACAYRDGVYFNNAELGTATIANGTDRIEVVLDWDAGAYTRDMLRVAYRVPGFDVYLESKPAGAGDAIVIDAKAPGSWSFWACPDTDTGDAGTPPLFSGELRFVVTAYRDSSSAL